MPSDDKPKTRDGVTRHRQCTRTRSRFGLAAAVHARTQFHDTGMPRAKCVDYHALAKHVQNVGSEKCTPRLVPDVSCVCIFCFAGVDLSPALPSSLTLIQLHRFFFFCQHLLGLLLFVSKKSLSTRCRQRPHFLFFFALSSFCFFHAFFWSFFFLQHRTCRRLVASESKSGAWRSDFRCLPLPLSPRTYFLFTLVIDHCVSSRQRLSAVFGGGNCHKPQVFDSNLELDFCFLGFGLRVVKTISGTWCCLSVFHECLLCKSLMYLMCLKVSIIWRAVHSLERESVIFFLWCLTGHAKISLFSVSKRVLEKVYC